MKTSLLRRSLLATASAVMLMGALLHNTPVQAQAQNKVVLRVSTPAVPDSSTPRCGPCSRTRSTRVPQVSSTCKST